MVEGKKDGLLVLEGDRMKKENGGKKRSENKDGRKKEKEKV